MKKMLMGVVIMGTISLTTFAGVSNYEKPKKHHCTAACTKEKHVYAHGEKGHVCTDACKKVKA